MKYFLVFILLVVLTIPHYGQRSGGIETQPPPVAAPGKIFGLVVGISKYKNIDSLSFAHTDAMGFANFLNSPAVRAEKVIEFYNEEATGPHIRDKGLFILYQMVSNNTIKENDIIIIYLAGHGGAYNSENSYFFPYDAGSMQDGATSIGIVELKNIIGTWVSMKRKVILVFDACRSKTIPGMPDDAIKKVSEILETKNGGILFAASSGGNEAQEFPDIKHGVFTYFFLKGLYGEADGTYGGKKDSVVTAKELGEYVYNNVKTKSQQKPKLEYDNQEDLHLVKVNQSLLVDVNKSIKPEQIISQYAARGRGMTPEKPLEEIENNFNERLKQNRLIKPSNDNACHYFQQLEKKIPDSPLLLEFRASLAAALYESARKVLENDLQGLRLYLRPSKDTLKTNGLDISYYADPLKSMETYQSLKKEDRNENVDKMMAYFKGRNEWLLYKNSEDSATSRNHLQKSMDIFSTAVARYPKEPYILEGYAVSLNGFIAVNDEKKRLSMKEVNIVTSLVERVKKLAPKWSYPYVTLGDLYFFLGNEEKEIKQYNTAIKVNKNDPTPYLFLGDVYFYRNDSVKALENSKKALENYLKAYAIDSALTFTLERLGDYYFEKKDLKNGSRYYDRLIRLDPKFASAIIDYADYLMDFDQTERAIELYKRVLKIDPDDEYNLYALAIALNDQGSNTAALTYIKRACALDPMDYYNQLLLGLIQEEMDDLAQARKTLEALTLKYPRYEGAFDELATVYQKQGDYLKAKVNYRKAFGISPKAYYLKSLIEVFEALDQDDSVVFTYHQIINLDPKKPSGMNDLGSYYYGKKNYNEALKYFEKAVQADPKYKYGYYNMGLSYKELKKDEQATGMFLKTLEISPTYSDAFYQMGVILTNQEKFNEAIAMFQKRILVDSTEASNYLITGFSLSIYIRDNIKAAEYFRKALVIYKKTSDDNPEDDTWLTSIAGCYYRLNAFDSAQIYLDKAQSINIKNDNAYAIRGYVFLRQGKKMESEKELTKALEMAPKNESRLFDMAWYYSAVGNKDKALNWLDKALALGYSEFVFIKYCPEFNSIRDSDEFKALIRKYNKG